MQASPLVTVGMPVFNGERYLLAAVNSILSERFSDWELVAVDDGSTDRSLSILLGIDDPRVRVIVNSTNLGLVACRNRILDEARGIYIAWLDQDDLTYPYRLEYQVKLLERSPHVGICGGWSDLLIQDTDDSQYILREKQPGSHAEIRAQMLFSNPLKCNTVMMRKSALVDHGLVFRTEFGNALDYDLWSRASDQMVVHNIGAGLGAYRIHASQTSHGRELEQINESALEVQRQLMLRSLGIHMNHWQESVHRRLTLPPVALNTPSELLETAEWLAHLRHTNGRVHAFSERPLDAVLTRQWVTALAGAQRGGVSLRLLPSLARQGLEIIGLPRTAFLGSVVTGIMRGVKRSRVSHSARSLRT